MLIVYFIQLNQASNRRGKTLRYPKRVPQPFLFPQHQYGKGWLLKLPQPQVMLNKCSRIIIDEACLTNISSFTHIQTPHMKQTGASIFLTRFLHNAHYIFSLLHVASAHIFRGSLSTNLFSTKASYIIGKDLYFQLSPQSVVAFIQLAPPPSQNYQRYTKTKSGDFRTV